MLSIYRPLLYSRKITLFILNEITARRSKNFDTILKLLNPELRLRCCYHGCQGHTDTTTDDGTLSHMHSRSIEQGSSIIERCSRASLLQCICPEMQRSNLLSHSWHNSQGKPSIFSHAVEDGLFVQKKLSRRSIFPDFSLI